MSSTNSTSDLIWPSSNTIKQWVAGTPNGGTPWNSLKLKAGNNPSTEQSWIGECSADTQNRNSIKSVKHAKGQIMLQVKTDRTELSFWCSKNWHLDKHFEMALTSHLVKLTPFRMNNNNLLTSLSLTLFHYMKHWLWGSQFLEYPVIYSINYILNGT